MTAMPPIAVLAGGLATRMRPLTEQVPKALLEVADEPFIAHQLRLLHSREIRQESCALPTSVRSSQQNWVRELPDFRTLARIDSVGPRL